MENPVNKPEKLVHSNVWNSRLGVYQKSSVINCLYVKWLEDENARLGTDNDARQAEIHGLDHELNLRHDEINGLESKVKSFEEFTKWLAIEIHNLEAFEKSTTFILQSDLQRYKHNTWIFKDIFDKIPEQFKNNALNEVTKILEKKKQVEANNNGCVV